MTKKIALCSFCLSLLGSLTYGGFQVNKNSQEEKWILKADTSISYQMGEQCMPSRFSKKTNILPRSKCRFG